MCIISSFEIKAIVIKQMEEAVQEVQAINLYIEKLELERRVVKFLRTKIKDPTIINQKKKDFWQQKMLDGLEEIAKIKDAIITIDPEYEIPEDPEVGEDGGEIDE